MEIVLTYYNRNVNNPMDRKLSFKVISSFIRKVYIIPLFSVFFIFEKIV